MTGGHVRINKIIARNLKNWVDNAKKTVRDKQRRIQGSSNDFIEKVVTKFEERKEMSRSDSEIIMDTIDPVYTEDTAQVERAIYSCCRQS